MLIGTSRFTDPGLPDLPAVRRNLDGLAACLRDPALWGLPAAHCTVVLDPDSGPALVDPVHDAAAAAEDTLLVYYAGHGLVHPRTNELLLALVGSVRGRTHTAVPYAWVRDNVVEAAAARRVVILDCCYSGRALGGMADPTTAVADEASAEGTYVLAAAPPNKQALSPPGETYTAFTGALLGLLNEGVPDGPELLALDDIYRHVRDALRRSARPQPEKRAHNTAGDLALVRNRFWHKPMPLLDLPPLDLSRFLPPPAPEPAPPDLTGLAPKEARELIKLHVRTHGMLNSYPCPVCQVRVRGRNLVRHYDKHVSAEPQPEPRLDSVRERLKATVRQDGTELTYVCPVCEVQVTGRNLIRHYDKHAARTPTARARR